MEDRIQKDALPINEEAGFPVASKCPQVQDYKLVINSYILCQISSKITKDNLDDMKFLCKQYINPSKWKKADDKFQFFHMLKTFVPHEEFPFFLAELLFTIQRFDLLKLIGICKHKGQHVFKEKSMLDPLKKLLFNILDSLDSDDASDVANELYRLVSPSKHNLDLASLFLELSDDENVKMSFLQTLHLKLRNENSPFANNLQTFLNSKEEKSVISNYCKEVSEQNEPVISSHVRLLSTTSLDQCTSTISISSNPSLMSISDNYYDMSCSPCGLCVIINIRDFKGSVLKGREGTDIDREKLKNVFTSFDFLIEARDNLTSCEIKSFLKLIAKRNHSRYSCFVCCVLSHGKKGKVAGSDNEFLDIQEDIIYPFSGSNCPSLLGKPKLFFIQACQGVAAMESASVSSIDIEEDGPSSCSEYQYLPDLSDHLLACATVPGFASFRSKSTGSWFIEFLTGQLKLTGHTDDILDVMRDVNRELSKMDTPKSTTDGKIKKQIPYPSYTLTKKLIFRKVNTKEPTED